MWVTSVTEQFKTLHRSEMFNEGALQLSFVLVDGAFPFHTCCFSSRTTVCVCIQLVSPPFIIGEHILRVDVYVSAETAISTLGYYHYARDAEGAESSMILTIHIPSHHNYCDGA